MGRVVGAGDTTYSPVGWYRTSLFRVKCLSPLEGARALVRQTTRGAALLSRRQPLGGYGGVTRWRCIFYVRETRKVSDSFSH